MLAATETQGIWDALWCSALFHSVKAGNLCWGGNKKEKNEQVRFYPGVHLGHNLSLAVVGVDLGQEGKLTLYMQTWGKLLYVFCYRWALDICAVFRRLMGSCGLRRDSSYPSAVPFMGTSAPVVPGSVPARRGLARWPRGFRGVGAACCHPRAHGSGAAPRSPGWCFGVGRWVALFID